MRVVDGGGIVVAANNGKRYSQQQHCEASRCIDSVNAATREGTLVQIYALVMQLLDLGKMVVRCRAVGWW